MGKPQPEDQPNHWPTTDHSTPERINAATHNALDRRVQRAMALMQKRLAHAWTVAELAAAVRLSVRQLERLFKDALEQSPMQYLQQLRLDQAEELLVTTLYSGKEIAARVGFHCERYFYREFKRSKGVSPRVYRQQHSLEGIADTAS
jgi:transcriptional regulator GlxA family with amidase domain